MEFQSTKERIGSLNSLNCLVEALKNELITLDLQNESIVTGVVGEVDGYMNILFGKAQLINLDNYCHHYETLYVKGRNIRFIHIPKQLSVRETILNYLKKSRVVHRAEKDAPTYLRRQKKLQKNQEETRRKIEELKESKK